MLPVCHEGRGPDVKNVEGRWGGGGFTTTRCRMRRCYQGAIIEAPPGAVCRRQRCSPRLGVRIGFLPRCDHRAKQCCSDDIHGIGASARRDWLSTSGVRRYTT